MLQQFSFWVCMEKNWNQDLKGMFAYPCALPLIHKTWDGNNLGVLQQMDGWRRCDVYTQWDVIQPWKKKEILAHVTTGMDPENMMLSEISPSQKDRYCMIPLREGVQEGQTYSLLPSFFPSFFLFFLQEVGFSLSFFSFPSFFLFFLSKVNTSWPSVVFLRLEK